MKKAKLKILSKVILVIFTSSMFVNINNKVVSASELHAEEMKIALSEKLYKQSQMKNLFEKLPSGGLKTIEELKSKNNKSIKKIDPNETIRVIIQLDDEPAIEKSNSDVSTNEITHEIKAIKSSQNSIIRQVEKLTGSKVK